MIMARCYGMALQTPYEEVLDMRHAVRCSFALREDAEKGQHEHKPEIICPEPDPRPPEFCVLAT